MIIFLSYYQNEKYSRQKLEMLFTNQMTAKTLTVLMSLLLSAGIESYAAISNGHMWTNVFFDNTWHVLEVDKDPERNKIYQIPGFYKNPVYKIFKDRTLKRKRIRNYRDG